MVAKGTLLLLSCYLAMQTTVSGTWSKYPKPNYPPPSIFPPPGTSLPGKSWKPTGFYPQFPQKSIYPSGGSSDFFYPGSGQGIFQQGFQSGGLYPGKSWGSSGGGFGGGFGGGKFSKQGKGLKGKLTALKNKFSFKQGSPCSSVIPCGGQQIFMRPQFIGYPQFPVYPGIGMDFGGVYPGISSGKSWKPPNVFPPQSGGGRCPRGPPRGPTGPLCRQDSDCGFPRRCCLIRGLKSIDDVKPLCVMPVFA